MTESPQFGRTPGAAAGIVDGQTVVVSPTDLRYHALNDTAAAVWALLGEGITVDQAVERLVIDFDVDEARCRHDVEACLDTFVSIGVAIRA